MAQQGRPELKWMTVMSKKRSVVQVPLRSEKPSFKPRTFAFPSGGTYPEKFSEARAAWEQFYAENPTAKRERMELEQWTMENMVQQYVDEHGFRPDGY
jgi:hypothetical protein